MMLWWKSRPPNLSSCLLAVSVVLWFHHHYSDDSKSFFDSESSSSTFVSASSSPIRNAHNPSQHYFDWALNPRIEPSGSIWLETIPSPQTSTTGTASGIQLEAASADSTTGSEHQQFSESNSKLSSLQQVQQHQQQQSVQEQHDEALCHLVTQRSSDESTAASSSRQGSELTEGSDDFIVIPIEHRVNIDVEEFDHDFGSVFLAKPVRAIRCTVYSSIQSNIQSINIEIPFSRT